MLALDHNLSVPSFLYIFSFYYFLYYFIFLRAEAVAYHKRLSSILSVFFVHIWSSLIFELNTVPLPLRQVIGFSIDC